MTSEPPFLFDKVVLVGVGLIGSSIGMNIVKKRLAREVIGVGRNQANLRVAVRRRAIHRGMRAQQAAPLLKCLSEDDLVILATPVRSIVKYFKILTDRPLVTDVGSTKGSIVREASIRGRRLRFVGSHPMAGTEKRGAAAGEINLFRGRPCFVIPAPRASSRDVAKINRLWRQLGSRTVMMDGARHDRLLALMSHLPHAVAFSLASAVSKSVPIALLRKYSWGSLRDMTRVVSSPPEMWRDIFLENRSFILAAMRRYQRELGRLGGLIKKGDDKEILAFLKRGHGARSGW